MLGQRLLKMLFIKKLGYFLALAEGQAKKYLNTKRFESNVAKHLSVTLILMMNLIHSNI